ncbi:Probable cytochrome P450 [Mycobacteroides abscessus subsp. abscessus]|nr:Probable cytochrome P450 [Mycobacteroides abscessus subsp. abscessus]
MVAGNETSRNAITHGVLAFADNPAQWRLYRERRPATAADEIIRWASPIIAFQRTALQDVELGGVQICKDQRVGMFYASANFDEDVFDDPFTFNIERDPNPHLSLLSRRELGPAGFDADRSAHPLPLGVDQRCGGAARELPRRRASWLIGRTDTRVWPASSSGFDRPPSG